MCGYKINLKIIRDDNFWYNTFNRPPEWSYFKYIYTLMVTKLNKKEQEELNCTQNKQNINDKYKTF